MTQNTDDRDGLRPGSFFEMVKGQVSSSEEENSDNETTGELNEYVSPLALEGDSPERIDSDESSNELSEMPHDARRALVYLMRQGTIIATAKPKLYEVICHHEPWIRQHLAEVFLRLVLDQKAGVAFVARVEDESGEGDSDTDEEVVSLISRRTLSLYDTLLLLVLRRHYQERESAGEQKITVDLEKLESYLTPFLPLTNHGKADRKKLNGAVQKLNQRKILSAIRGSEDRYEITPVIRYVVDAAFLESMLEEYLRLAAESGVSVDKVEKYQDSAKDHIGGQDDLLGGL